MVWKLTLVLNITLLHALIVGLLVAFHEQIAVMYF